MQSTFAGIEMGKRSLNAHNQALNTIGHNLANASSEGYSRQRVRARGDRSPLRPRPHPRGDARADRPGRDSIERIERIKDDLLEGRIDSESGLEGYWGTRDKYLLQLEQIHNEPSDSSVRTQMDKFWDSWQELSLRPSDTAAREAVLSRGEALAESMRDRYRRLSDFRSDGGRRHPRDRLPGERPRQGDRRRQPRDPEVQGHRRQSQRPHGQARRARREARPPRADQRRPARQGRVHGPRRRPRPRAGQDRARLRDARRPTTGRLRAPRSGRTRACRPRYKGGTLGALLELRDGDAKKEMQTLDTMALSFADLVNETHRAGYGANGKTGLDFFKEWPFINNVAGNYDRNGDGKYDSTYLYRMTGANALAAQEQIGLAGTHQALLGRAASTESRLQPDRHGRRPRAAHQPRGRRGDGEAHPRGQARAPRDARRGNAADPDFVVRHVEDSGQFLVGYSGLLAGRGRRRRLRLGPRRRDRVPAARGRRLRGRPPRPSRRAGSRWLPRSSRTSGSIAAGFGENGKPAAAGDGSAALAIAALRTQSVMVGLPAHLRRPLRRGGGPRRPLGRAGGRAPRPPTTG